ncbi:FG-GAP-like repeat-containing protein [Hydrogenophaga sp. 5NK40-0174]|uniref:FG-GAP-like repeat-containing protein n=1 Tax=Hydrogenophaga sp. 5NK40-0174 TaxID=3127649 RepID=UPI00333EE38C
MTGPSNGAKYTAPATIYLSASASDRDGSIKKVVFYVNGGARASDYGAPYKYTLKNVAAGTYTLKATATDNQNKTAGSASITVTVVAPTPPEPDPTPDPDPNPTDPGTTPAVSLKPGGIMSKLDVSPTGAAKYSVPISVPPGVLGLTPRISLDYDSHSRTGLLGKGWNMSGVSAISRCAKSLAIDGVREQIQYNQQDEFCLDGIRLELVSGSHGEDGAEYRLQHDVFSRVVANGAAAGDPTNGPESFTVQTKNGLLLQYGGSDDSRIEMPGVSVVRVWAATEVQDVKGNSLAYTYEEDNSEGAWRLLSAEYAGGRVLFSYEPRPDESVAYHAGYRFSNPVRLKQVSVEVDGHLVNKLTLGYSSESTPNGSMLSSMQQCDASGVCFRPTTYEWTDPGTRAFNNGFWGGHGDGVAYSQVVDMNGDGRKDLIGYMSSDDWHVCLSQGSTFYSCQRHSGPSGIPQVVGDINGDGRTDAAYYPVEGKSTWHICYAVGWDWNCAFMSMGWSSWNGKTVSGDFNGDGRTDMMAYKGSSLWHVCLSKGSSFSCSQWSGHGGGASGNLSGDFNGDGRDDIATYNSGLSKWNVCLSTGSNFSCSYQQANYGDSKLTLSGDFNGDGLSDIASYNSSLDKWNLCHSNGVGFNCAYQAATSKTASANKTGDFNGDGKTDLAALVSGTTWEVCLSTGDGFSCNLWVTGSGDVNNAFIGDYNGDGIDDMLAFYSGTNWKASLSNARHARRLNSISQEGKVASIAYASLSGANASAVYAKGASLTYPRMAVQAPLSVVQKISAPNGAGGTSSSSYMYGGFAMEHQSDPGKGLGTLGFRWSQETDDATGIQSARTYSQEWPYVGRVLVEETRKAGAGNAGVLKRATTTLACVQTTGAEQNQPCPASPEPGVTGFIYPSEVVIESWDLNGAAMPVVKASSVLAGTPDQAGGVRQFGDTTSAVVEIYQGGVLKSRKSTSNEYFPSQSTGGQWKLGRLKKATVTSTQY